MGQLPRSLLVFAALLCLFCNFVLVVAQGDSSCPTILNPSYDDPIVGSGWTAQLVAQDLNAPRGIAFDKNGALLVVQQGSGILHMTFADNGGTCLVVNQTRAVVNNTDVSTADLCSASSSSFLCSLEAVWRHDLPIFHLLS